jgi:dipeptidyl aminopeptidase/acylaminoacyl peptidase
MNMARKPHGSVGTMVIAALLLTVSGCVSMRVPENNWFHPGRAALSDSARAAVRLARGATVEEVRFAAADATRLYGLFVRTPGARTTVLYFGGDDFRVATSGLPLAQAASQLGVNAFLVDYRGYGESEGTPTLAALKQDALDAFDTLRRRGDVAGTAIVVHGFSMGSFIGAHVATERPVAGLVLESTATTVRDWARGFIPWYAKPFVRVRIAEALEGESQVARVQRYRGPLLLLVGADDRVTPPAMSRELYHLSATPEATRYLVIVPGAGHGDVLANDDAGMRYAQFLAAARP